MDQGDIGCSAEDLKCLSIQKASTKDAQHIEKPEEGVLDEDPAMNEILKRKPQFNFDDLVARTKEKIDLTHLSMGDITRELDKAQNLFKSMGKTISELNQNIAGNYSREDKEITGDIMSKSKNDLQEMNVIKKNIDKSISKFS